MTWNVVVVAPKEILVVSVATHYIVRKMMDEEAMSLVPLPPKEEFAELIEASEYPQELPEKF